MDKETKAANGWDQIDPALVKFVRAPVSEPPSSDGLPMPEELTRNREAWGAILKEPPPATPPAAGQDPARFIGPRSPEHPHVNRKPGGRENA